MSSYLEGADSDAEDVKKTGNEIEMNEEQKEAVLAMCAGLKAEGNGHFSKSEFDDALTKYTAALNLLKESGLPKDCLILLNRSATYLALKRFVPALNDANQGNLTNIFAIALVFFSRKI